MCDHAADDAVAQRRLEREQLGCGQPIERIPDAGAPELVRDVPQVLEL
jgi:hypothetical protein